MSEPITNERRKHQGDMYVIVTTYNLDDPDDAPPERREVINYTDPANRERLAKHMFWAWCNGRMVETMNLTDDVKND